MPVDTTYAQWLMAEARWIVRRTPSITDRWGESSIVTERVTGIATAADAGEEAERQLLFAQRGPFVIDVHQLVGTGWLSQLARVVTLTIDQLGYDQGVDVFVLEADVDHAKGISTIAVLRPLSATAGGGPAPTPTIYNTAGGSSRTAGSVVGFADRAAAIAARIAQLEDA